MNTRGLVELVILTVGLQLNVINDKVFAIMVVMALVTLFMTTPLLHLIYPASLLRAEQKVSKPVPAAKPFTILIPIAAPRSVAPLLQMADMLSGPGSPDRQIYGLHLRRPIDRPEFRSGLRRGSAPTADESVLALLKESEARRIPVELISFISRDVPRDIARVASEHHADLVLIGYHKPVFSRSMLGGTVHRILTQTATNVAVFADHNFTGAQRMLVPYLGGRHDRLAMKLAGRLAANITAQVTILHVTTPKAGMPPLNAKDAVDRVFNDPTQPLPVQLRVIESVNPVGTVIEQSADFDLVVIGVAPEEWGLESQLFGWRRERIASGVPTSLLIVRQYSEAESQDRAAHSLTGPLRPPCAGRS